MRLLGVVTGVGDQRVDPQSGERFVERAAEVLDVGPGASARHERQDQVTPRIAQHSGLRERPVGDLLPVFTAVGSSGVGKTHLAIALGLAACAQGRKVRFFRVTELITLLLEAREEKQLLRLRKQLAQLDLLILDELGYVPTGKAGAELLFDVLSTAYERVSLIVTTNLPFEHWTEVLGSERLTGAALDRLTHRCHILEAKGESYRLRDARRRQRPAAET